MFAKYRGRQYCHATFCVCVCEATISFVVVIWHNTKPFQSFIILIIFRSLHFHLNQLYLFNERNYSIRFCPEWRNQTKFIIFYIVFVWNVPIFGHNGLIEISNLLNIFLPLPSSFFWNYEHSVMSLRFNSINFFAIDSNRIHEKNWNWHPAIALNLLDRPLFSWLDLVAPLFLHNWNFLNCEKNRNDLR